MAQVAAESIPPPLRPKLKVIVRHLPPHLPLNIFLKTVEKWVKPVPIAKDPPPDAPSEESQSTPPIPDTEYNDSEEQDPTFAVDWWRYNPGKLSKGKGKENVASKAYLHFKTPEALMEFYQEYNGHVFVDSKGVESRALVELAPYQRIPKLRRKEDPKMNTIEQDPEYMAFLESLNETESKPKTQESVSLSDIVLPVQKTEMVAKSTPLLEALRARKAVLAAKKAEKMSFKLQKRKEKKQQKKEQDKASKKKKEKRDSNTSVKKVINTEKFKVEIIKNISKEALPATATPQESPQRKEPRRNKQKEEKGNQGQEAKPKVMILKRDGSSSQFHVGEERSSQQPSPQSTPKLKPEAPSFTPKLKPDAPSFTPKLKPDAPSFTPKLKPDAPSFTPKLKPDAPTFTPTLNAGAPVFVPPTQLYTNAPSFTPQLNTAAPAFIPSSSSSSSLNTQAAPFVAHPGVSRNEPFRGKRSYKAQKEARKYES